MVKVTGAALQIDPTIFDTVDPHSEDVGSLGAGNRVDVFLFHGGWQ